MTTIAYKSGIIAADRRAIVDYHYVNRPIKIWKHSAVGSTRLFGGAGNGPQVEIWKDWIISGGLMEDRPSSLNDSEEYVAGLEIISTVGAEPRIFFHGRFGPAEIIAEFWAIGSGGALALGAMAMGATAIQAVEIASKFDSSTGPEIDWLSFAQPATSQASPS